MKIPWITLLTSFFLTISLVEQESLQIYHRISSEFVATYQSEHEYIVFVCINPVGVIKNLDMYKKVKCLDGVFELYNYTVDDRNVRVNKYIECSFVVEWNELTEY